MNDADLATILVWCVCAGLLTGCLADRPAPQSLTVATAPSIQPALAGPPAPAALPPVDRVVDVALAWDASPSPGVTNYAVHYGPASGSYTNRVDAGANLTATVSNLAPATRYYFAATAQAHGLTSPFSEEIFWPQPITNYVTVTVTRRAALDAPAVAIWSQTLTNPPGDQAFFETTIRQTNDAVSVLRINSSTLLIANTNQP